MSKELAKTEGVSGLVALGEMSDEDFKTRIAMLRRSEQRVSEVYQNVLTKGYDDSFDLMKFKGDSNKDMKPFLTQNGANTTMRMFGLIVSPGEIQVTYGNEATRDGKYLQPPLTVRVEMFLHEGSKDGPCVGSAWGVANSFERKYRYRNAEKECPECNKAEGQLRVSRKNDRYTEDQHFYCFAKIGGCGAQFAKTDPRIVDQKVGLIDNPDPMDLEETLTRIAEKRGGVAVVARHTGLKRYVNIDPEAAGWDRVRPSGVTVEADYTVQEPLDGKQQAEAVLKQPVKVPQGQTVGEALAAANEPMAVSPQEVVKSATPNPTPETKKAGRDAWKQAQGDKEKAKSQADGFWLPPMEWHEWASAALGVLGDENFKQTSLEAMNAPKNRNVAVWSKQMMKMAAALKANGQSAPPMPEGVLTEGMQ